jgi:hypothetical protein
MPAGPFVDPDSRELDLEQIRQEAIPLVGLIVLFGALAFLPVLVALLLPSSSLISFGLLVVAQLVLAVGAALVLLYVVARGNQLADSG